MTDEYLLRIGLALLVGAVLGAEREHRDKAAGSRTIILICVASALIAIVSVELVATQGDGDPTRIAAGTVTGVGFLGAGVIMRLKGRLSGITTAASIWAAAALGLGLGVGMYAISLTAAAAILVILWLLPPIERLIDRQRESLTYTITSMAGHPKVEELERTFAAHDLRIHSRREAKQDGALVVRLTAMGSDRAHRSVMEALSEDDEIPDFDT